MAAYSVPVVLTKASYNKIKIKLFLQPYNFSYSAITL